MTTPHYEPCPTIKTLQKAGYSQNLNFGHKTNVAGLRAGGIKGRRELGPAKKGPIR